jgi:hypothetical protein
LSSSTPNIHSDDATVVWLPEQQLLLCGDTMEDTITYVDEPESFDVHLANLSRLRELAPDRILPNHGAPEIIGAGGYSQDLIGATEQYIRALERCRTDPSLRDAGLQQLIAGSLEAGSIRYYAPYEAVHRENVETVLAAGEQRWSAGSAHGVACRIARCCDCASTFPSGAQITPSSSKNPSCTSVEVNRARHSSSGSHRGRGSRNRTLRAIVGDPMKLDVRAYGGDHQASLLQSASDSASVGGVRAVPSNRRSPSAHQGPACGREPRWCRRTMWRMNGGATVDSVSAGARPASGGATSGSENSPSSGASHPGKNDASANWLATMASGPARAQGDSPGSGLAAVLGRVSPEPEER